ncbi:hypothetical protein EON63_07140 [archaeon]|nr:MAG: hypothetical protein EON63_07140 [archaeon]
MHSPIPYTHHLKHFLRTHTHHPILAQDVLDVWYGEGDDAHATHTHTISTLCILSSYPPSHTHTLIPPHTPYTMGPNEVLVRVYRHVNGKPLYAHTHTPSNTPSQTSSHTPSHATSPFADTLNVCALTRGVRRYGWGRHNIQLTICNDDGDGGDGMGMGMGMYNGVLVGILKSVTEEMGVEMGGDLEGGGGVVVDLYVFFDSQAGMVYDE